VKDDKKKAVRLKRQFDSRFGVGDKVTVVAARTDSENKVKPPS